jgi:septal ring-binding cell division protein DamX
VSAAAGGSIVAATANAVAKTPANPAGVSAQPTAEAGKTLDARIAASEEWLLHAPASHYFIQLISTTGGDRATAERILGTALRQLDADQVRAYRSRLSGNEKVGVIYGDYPTAAAAEAAVGAMPAQIGGIRPYVRQVLKLR